MQMNPRRAVGGLTVLGGAVLLRPGTRANRAIRHQVEAVGRRVRHLGGRLPGVAYRVRGRHPDPDVSGAVLADRIRSTLGPLQKRLDLPHVNVMAEDHVAVLHGVVATQAEADEIERAVAAVSGVSGVESYLHVGLGQGDSRPSTGRAVEQPSEAHRRLLDAATGAGVDPAVAPSVVRTVLATLADRIPGEERSQVATHLPADVRSMFVPPRRLRQLSPVRTTEELVARVAADTDVLPSGKALELTRAVVGQLRALVPDEAADVAAVLPAELRDLWEQR